MEKHIPARAQPRHMIGVVGGTVAGLVVARELRERGREVRIFESGRELGGLAATTPTDGDRVERLPTTLSPADDAVADLAAELGIADRLSTDGVRTGYYVDGIAHPRTKLSEKLAFPRLSTQDKLFESLLARGVSIGPLGPPDGALDAPEAYDDVTAFEFVDEHATASVREQVVEPRLRAEFGDRAEDVSAAWLLGDLARRRAGRTWRTDSRVYPEGGVATLVDALVAGVGRENVALGARVVGVETAEEGDAADAAASDEPSAEPDETGFVWNDADERSSSIPDSTSSRQDAEAEPGDAEADGGVETDGASSVGVDDEQGAAPTDRDAAAPTERVDRLVVEQEGERDAVDVDAVVFATPPRALDRATDYEWAGETRGVLSVLFGLSESLLDAYELTVADEAPFGRLVEHTNVVSPDNYGGDHLLYAVAPVASTRDDRWQLDDDALARRWVEALEGLFPAFDREAVRWSTVTRARDAGPVYETGYRERRIPHDLSDAVAEGCFYAGDASEAQYPTRTVDGAVRAGRRCAELVASSGENE